MGTADLKIGSQQLHLVAYKPGTFRRNKAIIPWDIHFAIEVNDFGEAVRFLYSKGFRENPKTGGDLTMIIDPNANPGRMYIQLYIKDPEGHLIEITEATSPSRQIS